MVGEGEDPVATGESYRYTISREKIREYALALGEQDPRYFSDGDDCVAPPTFAACFTVARGAEELVDVPDRQEAAAGLIHGSQAFEYPGRPLRPGDQLVCTPRLTDSRRRGEAQFLTLEVECRFAEDDRPAVIATGRFIRFGAAAEETEPAEPAEAET